MNSDRVNKNNRERDLECTLFFNEVSFAEPGDNVQIRRCIWGRAGLTCSLNCYLVKIITDKDLLSIFFA